MRNIPILGNWDQSTNSYGISKVPRPNGRHFFFGKGHESNKQVPAISWPIPDLQNILPPSKWPKPTNKNFKNTIFQDVAKNDLEEFKY